MAGQVRMQHNVASLGTLLASIFAQHIMYVYDI